MMKKLQFVIDLLVKCDVNIRGRKNYMIFNESIGEFVVDNHCN